MDRLAETPSKPKSRHWTRFRPARIQPSQIRTDAINNEDLPEARRFTIKGRVQGVWFRDSTRREAQRLHITGYARNLSDGNVEVSAFGTAAALDELARWLRRGPPMARVNEVLEAAEPRTTNQQPPTTFEIG